MKAVLEAALPQGSVQPALQRAAACRRSAFTSGH